MKSGQNNHTLRWDQALPAAQRFVVLAAFNNAAVLDKNTGLVWEKSPEIEIGPDVAHNWSPSRGYCLNKAVGGQKGWRLPSAPELASLIDPSVGSPGPTLPPGHPFTNVKTQGGYWSATTSADGPSNAWIVFFGTGISGVGPKDNPLHVWCVRGGMNADAY